MPQELISALQSSQTIILHMVQTNQANPLISSPHHGLSHSLLVSVEFQWICIEGVDSDGTPHSFKEDRALNTTNNHFSRERAVDEIHGFQVELVQWLSFNRNSGPRRQVEQPWKASNRASSHHNFSRNKDCIEKVESDFSMIGEPLDFGECKAVVRSNGVGKEIHRREKMCFLIRTFFLSV